MIKEGTIRGRGVSGQAVGGQRGGRSTQAFGVVLGGRGRNRAVQPRWGAGDVS
jgi:hypothetical protein